MIGIMRKILIKYGTIKDEYDKNFTIFFLLDYGQHHKNIKVELSKKSSKYDAYETINFYGTDISAMTKEGIFANKLLALYRRYKNRDLFDV
jgi:predicted nucleotidyltransferase component of viral defense system